LNCLLDVFIDGTITKEDFASHKERLVQEKASLSDSVARMEVHGATRFKPLADFISASRQAKYDAETDDLEELRNWHKKTGSNLLLAAAGPGRRTVRRLRRTEAGSRVRVRV